MVIVHNIKKRKPTGGRYKDVKPKKLSQRGNLPSNTRIGDKKAKTRRLKGGDAKKSLMAGNEVNIFDSKKKKSVKGKITNVSDNKASRHFVRRNIITKGAVLETDKGTVKVTNRPGQEGTINAVLVE